MQILPLTETATNYTQQAKQAEAYDTGFAALVEQLATVPAEITPDIDNLADIASDYAKQLERTVVSSPYTTHAQVVNERFEPEEVRYTPAEVEKFASNLETMGADQQLVQAVRELAGNDLGVTSTDILQTVMQASTQAVQLTESDLQSIFALGHSVSQSGEAGALSAALLDTVRKGQGLAGLQAFMQALAAADQNQPIMIRRDELMAFGKGLGLSEKTLSGMAGMLGAQNELALTPDDLRRILAEAAQELTSRAENQKKMAAQLEAALGPVQQEAKRRMQLEHAASERKNREVDHSVTLIQDKVTRNSFIRQQNGEDSPVSAAQRGEQEATHHSVPVKGQAVSAQAEPSLAGAKPATETTHEKAEHTTQRQPDDAAPREHGRKEFFAREDGGAAFGKDSKQWNALLDKVEVKHSTLEQAGLFGMHQMAQPTGEANHQADVRGATRAMSARLLDQIEQAMLSASKNGGKRLELQLAPSELGVVNVILTSKNGEISAMIRPEKSETAAVISQQADQLRFALEQQGLKVDKVEVQTQLQDNRNNSTWQGMDQHNQSREQQEHAQMLERHRRIARLQQQDNSVGMLAQNMQNTDMTATIAARGLYIVA